MQNQSINKQIYLLIILYLVSSLSLSFPFFPLSFPFFPSLACCFPFSPFCPFCSLAPSFLSFDYSTNLGPFTKKQYFELYSSTGLITSFLSNSNKASLAQETLTFNLLETIEGVR